MADHVHILFSLPQTMSLAKAVQILKANSSKWMNERGRQFAWQEGYSAFSVSVSNTPIVAKYIREQEQHHRKMSFEKEYKILLEKHGMEIEAE
jgi:putative transposase